jgi:hypothetical protein
VATQVKMECVRRRPFPVDHVLARCAIVVDGHVIARLREGAVQIEDVPPGPHRIAARTIAGRSRELTVNLADGEPVRLLVERRKGGSLDLRLG